MSDDAKFHVELEDGVSEPAHKMGGALEKLLGFFDRFEGAGESVHRVMEFAFGGLLEDAIEKVGEFGKEIVGGTFEMAAFGQEAEEAFRNITGSAELGQEALERARTVSERLGLDIRNTSATMEQFMRLGFSSAQAEGMVKMGADLRTVGVEAGKVDSIMSALTRMQARGVMDSRAMLELAGAGVQTHNVYARLADQLGTTEEAVKKMGESGKISAAQAIGAIQGELLGKLGETAFGEKAAQSADETLDGLKNRLSAKLQGLQMDIGKQIAPALTESLKAAGDALDRFIHSADGAATISALKTTLMALAESAAFVVSHLGDVVAVVRTGIGVFQAIWPLLVGVAAAYATWGTVMLVQALPAIVAMIPELVVMTANMAALAVATIAAAAPYLAVGAAVAALIYLFLHWEQVVAIVKSAFGAFTNWIKSIDWAQMGVDLVVGFYTGLIHSIPKIVDGARKVGGAVVDTLRSMFKMHSPSLVMAEMGEFTAQGFGQGIESGTRHVETAATGMANAAVAPVGGAKGGARGGDNTVHLNIEVTAPPGGSQADAQRFGDHLGPIIERQLMAFHEGLSLSAA